MAYENERAMFEAFSRNKYRSTGVIQWMLNNAWPSLHWNLFDWFLEPNGSTFGAKVANEPLHVQYGYDDRSVAVIDQTPDDATGLTVQARGVRPSRRRALESVHHDGCGCGRRRASVPGTRARRHHLDVLRRADLDRRKRSRRQPERVLALDRRGTSRVAPFHVVLHADEVVRGLHRVVDAPRGASAGRRMRIDVRRTARARYG